MKEYRVKPSKAAVTTIDVASRHHHYFHSESLGKSRAILISPDENLPVPFQLTDKAKTFLAESKRPKLEQDSQESLVQEQAAPAPKILSKGEQLEVLMNCSKRLHRRWEKYYYAIYALPENDLKGRNAAFAKLERVHKAVSRLSKRIQALILELP